MPSIHIESDELPGRLVELTKFPARIGKQRDNEIVLSGWRIARVHAEIHRIDQGFRLIDLGSIGGTWVNGERIAEYGPIEPADEIRIAGFRLRLEPVRSLAAVADATQASDMNADIPGAVSGARTVPILNRNPSLAADAAPQDVMSDGKPPTSNESGRQSPVAVTDPVVEWRRSMHRRLLQAIDLRRRDVRQLSDRQLREEASQLLGDLLDDERDLPPGIDRARLVREILDEAIGLGPLEALLADASVSEIMVNTPAEIFVERHGRLERSSASFTGEQAVRSVIDRIVAPLGRRIDESSPMVDARLPDGSRVNAVVPPLAVRGTSITIRRFGRRLLRPEDLVAMGSASPQMLEFLKVCVRARRNIVISGGTGSGKTTLLNLLSNLIDTSDRIVTIEDAAELQLRHPNLVSLEARPSNAEGRGLITIRDLVRNALRMRPDRIVVGECRGGEALDMLQAMNTGHDGSLTTLHANAPRDVISRLETMVLMSGVDLPVTAIREQIASAIDIIVHQSRLPDGSRRIVEIVEVTGIESGKIQTQPLFRLRRTAGFGAPSPCASAAFEGCAVVPHFYEEAMAAGESLDLEIFGELSR